MNDSFHFSNNSFLLFLLVAGVGPLLTHTITGLYNIIEYLLTTVMKKFYILN